MLIPQRMVFYFHHHSHKDYYQTRQDRDRDRSLILDYLKVEVTACSVTDTHIEGSATVTTYVSGRYIIDGYTLEKTSYRLTHDRKNQSTIVRCHHEERPLATQAAHRLLQATEIPNENTTVSDALHCAILADMRPTHYIAVEQNGLGAENMGAAADIQLGALSSTLDHLILPWTVIPPQEWPRDTPESISEQ